MTTECKCSFAHRVVGDGCRYCQPQTYIDNLELMIAEMREEEAAIGAGGVERLRSPAASDAFAARYQADPDDPACREEFAIYQAGWADADRAARAQAPAAVEPVAWRYKRRGDCIGDFWFMPAGQSADDLRIGRGGEGVVLLAPCPGHFDWTPLYAAPTTKAEPAPTADEFSQLSKKCQAMPGGIGMWYLNYGRAVLERWGAVQATPADAETALLKVLSAVQRYLPPDGISIDAAMSEIIASVDPWPIGNSISAQRAQAQEGAKP